jgi:nitroreductase
MPAAEHLLLSPDELLTTTRAVRRRLDLDRPVQLDLVHQCLRIARQAPSGSAAQGWAWIVVTDPEQKSRIAEVYRRAFAEYRASATGPGQLFATDRPPATARTAESVAYLAENLHRVPVLLLTGIHLAGSAVLADDSGATRWGSLFPWSYMLAARARGLGTVWTDLHLRHEPAVAEILGLPDDVRQGPLIPTAHTVGTDFRPAHRAPLEDVVHHDHW